MTYSNTLLKRLESLEKKMEEIEFYDSSLEPLRNQIDRLHKKLNELENWKESFVDHGNPVKANQVVAENATSEEQDCLWVARDKRTDTLYVYEVEPVAQYCETFAADDEEEKSFRIDFDLFPQVTFENSPQKLVLESSIVFKTARVGDWKKQFEDQQKRVNEFENKLKGLDALKNLVNAEPMPREFQEVLNDNLFDLAENSEKPNNQDFDRQRALEFIRDIERCTIDNSNSATKAILSSCMDLRRLLGGSDD